MSSSAFHKSVSFDEQEYSYESIGTNHDRYSVGSNYTPRQSLLPPHQTHGSSHSSYQNYNRDVSESKYHSDQGADRRRSQLNEARERENKYSHHNMPKRQNSVHAILPRTGRQRKKAARVKYTAFQAAIVKRRLYFCCVANEVDIAELEFSLSRRHATTVYGDALCIPNFTSQTEYMNKYDDDNDQNKIHSSDENTHLFDPTCQSAVFIFEFGTVVFWGLKEEDEMNLLAEIRQYTKTGEEIHITEFESGEDDMAFIAASIPDDDDEEEDNNTKRNQNHITITNDLLTIPDPCHLKELLAVSYAISQSTVLAIFEERIDRKVAEYKFIPETLSLKGKINMPLDRVGMMIGDIFVIRHGLNLHSDVLDTPDFFWDEDKYKPNYSKMMLYLEMEGRIMVLNKRLDMLKELLDMLQHQIHNAHATKLEWIVIWLIIIEVLIEVIGGGGGLLGLWVW